MYQDISFVPLCPVLYLDCVCVFASPSEEVSPGVAFKNLGALDFEDRPRQNWKKLDMVSDLLNEGF